MEATHQNTTPEALPPGGGRYVRHEDGSLEQVAHTKPAPSRAKTDPAAEDPRPAADEQPE